jgi:glycosyltransferase involved in cell wall biosynthesis
VVVPVKNEQANLSRCLEPLIPFAEVVVVDSGSQDSTTETARHFGAKVLQFAWNGRYPKKRNWVLLNYPFKTEWVLFLDADEIIDVEFCKHMAAAIQLGCYNGFWLNYTNHFMGRKLRHGVPQRKLALFKVGSGLYERIEEHSWTKLDMEIHEHPLITGPVGEILAPIEHNDYRGIDNFVDRHRDYARWEARRFLLLEREGELDASLLTERQRFKYGNIQKWWYPWLYFGYSYFVRGGFLDGSAGFYYACYKTWYFLTVRVLIAEFRKADEPNSRILMKSAK